MAGINYTFDATQYAPEQSAGSHPIGKFEALISNTEIKPTSSGDGGMFVVEFTTPQGRISLRYNLWNQNQKAVDIAHKQLSALCHATGVFKVGMENEGAALRNARCMIEVGKQKDSEYTEVKRVFDAAGNEPGKPATQASQQAFAQPAAAPQAASQPAPAPAWNAPQTGGAAPAPQAWAAPAQAPQAAPAAAPEWNQTQPAANAPPWAR